MFDRFRHNLYLSGLILLTGVQVVFAQEGKQRTDSSVKAWSIGLTFMAQQTGYFNRQINLSDYSPEPTFGRATGISGRIYFGRNYFILWEGLNSFQGQKYSYSQEEIDTAGNRSSAFLYTRSFELNYYKFPVMPGVILNPGRKIQIHASLGPQIAYLNTAYYVLDADTVIRRDRSFKQTLKTIDLGMVFCTGIQAEVSHHLYFNAAIRTDISLLDTESIRFKPVSYASSKNFTGGISFGLTWVFHPEVLQKKTEHLIEPE